MFLIIVIGFEILVDNPVIKTLCTAEYRPRVYFVTAKSFSLLRSDRPPTQCLPTALSPCKASRKWSLRPARNMSPYHAQGQINLTCTSIPYCEQLQKLQLAQSYKLSRNHVLCRTNSKYWIVNSKVLKTPCNINTWNIFRGASKRNHCRYRKRQWQGYRDGRRGNIWKFLRGWLDRNRRVIMVVKDDCSGVQIFFVSSIA